MQQIIYFFIRNKNSLIFAFLFVISVLLTIQSHNYHSDMFMSSANAVTGGIYNFKTNLTTYFTLGSENEKLLEENLKLHQELKNLRERVSETTSDSLEDSKYRVFSARVIDNNYALTKNYITIDKGATDSLVTDMGVISDKGLVGILGKVSKKYAIVQSILNTNSKINAKLSKSGHFGTLVWDAENPQIVQLVDIPRMAQVQKGDTVVTGGRSIIFPEGILIGTVIDYEPDVKDDNYYKLNVELFNDMTSLQFVYLIENKEVDEILELEKEVQDGD